MKNDIEYKDVIVGDLQCKSDVDYNETMGGAAKKEDIIQFSNLYNGKTGCGIVDVLKSPGTERSEEQFTGKTPSLVQ